MNKFSLILDLGVLLLAFGVFLVSFRLFVMVAELVTRLWRRFFVSWASRKMRQLRIVRKDDVQKKQS